MEISLTSVNIAKTDGIIAECRLVNILCGCMVLTPNHTCIEVRDAGNR